MVAKGVTIWLLLLVSYGSAGSRVKRKGLLSISQPPPPPPYPIWKVHRYTGLQLQQVEQQPHKEHPTENEAPSVVGLPDYPVSEPDEPAEEDHDSSGGLGSILSLIPGGLTGLISLSGGSGRNEEETGYEEGQIAEDRLGLVGETLVGLKKDILTSILRNKIDLLTALKRDALQLLIRKAQAKKAWINNLLFGSHPGYYNYYLPYYYPKKASFLSKLSYLPFVGHWFGSGTRLPEVHLPYVPNLVALKDPPPLPVIDLHGKYQFPYQSGTYVKVDYPDKDKPVLKPGIEYQLPSTSYGVPESAISVPQLPVYEKDPLPFSYASYEPAATSAAPDIAAPEVYPYPPAVPAEPQYPVSYTYPQEAYPYASNDYYDTAPSEFHPVRERPVYKHSEDTKKETAAEDKLGNILEKEPAAMGTKNRENTEKTKRIVPK